MASDSAATFGAGGMFTIGQQEVQKVRRLNDQMLYSATGAVGMAQLISERLDTLWSTKALASAKNTDQAMNQIGVEIGKLVSPYLQTANLTRPLVGDASGSLCKSLLAFPVNHVPQLVEFDFNGAPERKTSDLPFVALGSGQPIADPFLAYLKRLLWKSSEPTVAEGRLVAAWTIDHVARTNPGGVGGRIQLGVLERVAGKNCLTAMVDDADIAEHLQRIEAAEKALLSELRGEALTTAVPPPPPPTQPADAPHFA